MLVPEPMLQQVESSHLILGKRLRSDHGSFSTFRKLIAPCSFHSNSVFCNCFYESIGSLYYCSTKIQIFIMYVFGFFFRKWFIVVMLCTYRLH